MRREKKTKINYGILIFRLISILIIAICLYVLYLWQQDNLSNTSIQNDLTSLITTEPTTDNNTNNNSSDNNTLEENNISNFNVDFNALLEKNSESVGWIKIDNTNINYPIVKASNNEYYLTRNINKEKNGAGWIFADYRNNFETLDKNTIIYGHNRRNGTMFSNLKYYLDSNYCADSNHKYINFITRNQNYIAEIFSVYKISASKVDLVTLNNTFSSEDEFNQTIDLWKNSSVYDFQTPVSYSDNILTLYTCDNNTSYRILVHAKLMSI